MFLMELGGKVNKVGIQEKQEENSKRGRSHLTRKATVILKVLQK
jgi:hypothetical protein